jgi:hypothetical protein
LLLAFVPRDKHWWEYLDVVENALDAGEQADLSLLPGHSPAGRGTVANTW